MARIPMVTRTVKATHATVMAVDLVKGEVFNDVAVCPRTYKNDADVMKFLSKEWDNAERKAVQVISTEVVETLMGMTELEFIKLAKPITKGEADEVDD